ncbi:MAG: hypothetical protein HFJ26_08505 [Clostridia bacterium]|nr:hypothetical protein [Clostridia bacterium]
MNKKKEEKTLVNFTKEQIVNSKKYDKSKDLLQAILKENENYTTDEVDKKIENFMKRKV